MKASHIKTTISVVLPYSLNGKEGFIFVKTAKDKKWGLPAGKIDLFEEINSAASREISEEIGLEIVLESFLGTWDFRSDRGSSISNRVFLGNVLEGEIKIENNQEILDLRILNLKEIRMLFRQGKLRAGRANLEPVEEFLRGIKYPLSIIKTLF
jgi:8-oxo-dGTP diphosphatase